MKDVEEYINEIMSDGYEFDKVNNYYYKRCGNCNLFITMDDDFPILDCRLTLDPYNENNVDNIELIKKEAERYQKYFRG